MRLRRCLLLSALVLVMPLTGSHAVVAQEVEKLSANGNEKILEPRVEGASAEVEMAAPVPVPLPTPLEQLRGDQSYTSAYRDVYSILSTLNPCSSFFGGPLRAVEVLNGLYGQLKPSRIADTKIALTMSGRVRTVSSARTGVNYRLFEKAVINTNGPFYKKKTYSADPFVPNVGSFQPNTREARAAILLHEVGHLLQGEDGRWLLPNDGMDDAQSRKNTDTIETRCGEQIKELRRSSSSGGSSAKTPARK